MFYNTPKSLNFRGALNVNRLCGGHEKLSTIGAETVETSCSGFAWYDFWTYFCKQIVSEAMERVNLLHYATREELRRWLEENHEKEHSCWVVTHRGKCPEWPAIPYIEVVEEALCFGWIDSTLKRLPDGRLAQRLSPRRAKSHWTELNKQRCRDLEERGLMTEAGRRALEKP